MARYRPISPNATWRSTQTADMGLLERYVELYLLTNTFANSIGCYRLVEVIAAAETGLGREELLSAINGLQQRGLVTYADGFMLVRRWFFHSTWDSTFRGKVTQSALREVMELPAAMQLAWREACQQAGVSVETLDELFGEPLGSPMKGAGKGLAHGNNNEQRPKQETNVTTTTLPVVDTVSSGGDISRLDLLPLVEQHRAFIEACTSGLLPEQAQMIADEFGGVFESAARGERQPVHGLHRWLPTLVNNLKEGSFVPQFGPGVAKRRDKARKAVKVEQEIAQRKEEDRKKLNCLEKMAASLLSELPLAELKELAEKAASYQPVPRFRERMREEILARKVPEGLGRVELMRAVDEWVLKGGALQ